MTISIMSTLLEDHESIKKLIEEYEKSKDKDTLKKLQKKLSTHFIEEEILYSKYEFETHKKIPVVQRIMDEHKLIKEKLENNTEEALGLIRRHKNIEERLVYPEFEKNLSEWDKEEAYREIKNK
jgi:hypothetical protein